MVTDLIRLYTNDDEKLFRQTYTDTRKALINIGFKFNEREPAYSENVLMTFGGHKVYGEDKNKLLHQLKENKVIFLSEKSPLLKVAQEHRFGYNLDISPENNNVFKVTTRNPDLITYAPLIKP